MRTLIHAAFLAGLLVPGAAYAADLDRPYEEGPPPVAVVPPPPPVAVLPPCGVYRPCFRPYRLGFWRRPWRFGYAGPRPYVVGPRPYAVAPRPEGYGYDYDRERYEGAHEHFSRYGYAHPRPEAEGPRGGYGPEGYGPRGYGRRDEPRDGYGPRGGYEPRGGYGPREQYGQRHPYADPLGHDGYERRGGRERFDRGPGPDERG